MSFKNTSDLQIGMTLAADVRNLDGQILFRKGKEIGARQIEILQMWGIASVEIEGGDSGAALEIETFPQLTVEQAEAAVNQRLKLAKSSHPAVDVIRSLAVLEAAKALQKSHRAS